MTSHMGAIWESHMGVASGTPTYGTYGTNGDTSKTENRSCVSNAHEPKPPSSSQMVAVPSPPVTEDDGHLRRHEWRIRPTTQAEAIDFISRIHYAGGAPNTSVARHGLCTLDDDKLHGVALWLPPTKAAAVSVNPDNWQGVLALSRLCIAPGMPTNSASFLLGASMRLLDRSKWPTLLTYADTREGHTGAIYKATNWTCLGEVRGSDAWAHRVTGERRGRKRGGLNLSSAEMAEAGFVRLPTMPKIKFVHERNPA